MRILVVSNHYPPYHVGGYEMGCRDVVEAFKARGYQVMVLTSTHGVSRPEAGDGVFRWLRLNSSGPDFSSPTGLAFVRWLVTLEVAGQTAFRRVCRLFRPDLVYFWNMACLPISLVFAAQRRGLPTAFFVSDHWLRGWWGDPWRTYLARRRVGSWRGALTDIGLAALSLFGVERSVEAFDLSRVQFCSRFLQREALEGGLPVGEARVVHWGIDTARFTDTARAAPRRLLYVGQIMRHKGVHTAVAALGIVRRARPDADVTLTVVGGGDAAYMEDLRRQVAAAGLDGAVDLAGAASREDVIGVYAAHDVLVFPSCWEEPFAITPLEAMSSGLAVVGTTTGGSAEIFREGVNALTFPRGDAEACARQVVRLLDDPALFSRLRRQGRETVQEEFRFADMVSRLADALDVPPSNPMRKTL